MLNVRLPRLFAVALCFGSTFGAAAEDLALRTYRICNTSPLLLKKRGPLNPDDMATAPIDPAWIVNTQVLAVRMSYPDGACDAACRRTVSETFVSAVNLWRQLCLQCGYGLFAFVVDQDDVYIERNVARSIVDRGTPLFDRILNAHRTLLGITGEKPTGDGHAFGSYTRVHRTDRALQDFCGAKLAPEVRKLWPGKLAAAICGGEVIDAAPIATIEFDFTPPCNDPSFIACGTSAVGLQLDLAATAYVIRRDPAQNSSDDEDVQKHIDATPILLGNPSSYKVDLEAIFIHEVGHFLGIGHLSAEDEPATNATPAMRAVYNPKFCLSNAETMLVNSAASARWRFKAEPCMGVRRPPRSQ